MKFPGFLRKKDPNSNKKATEENNSSNKQEEKKKGVFGRNTTKSKATNDKMGCVPSKPADAAVVSNGVKPSDRTQKASEDKSTTSNGGAVAAPKAVGGANSSSTPVVNIPADIRRKEWAVRPGYSSGASSFASDSEHESSDSRKGTTSKDTSSGRKERSDSGSAASTDSKKMRTSLNHSQHTHILDLQSLKQEIIDEGVFSQAVVRIETPFGKPIEEIYDGVHDGPVLGSGVSGIVRLITHRATGLKYAVKVLDLGMIDTTEGLMALRNEIFILSQLDHPNVVRIEEVYESSTDVYIVQELCLGGDLFDRLDEQTDYHYTEAQCARLIKQMLSSVRYLHSKGIVHRDLKLENFLFSSTAVDSDLKIIDFGLSKHFDVGDTHNDKVGTPYTVAPEIIRGEYDEKCDIWALGVITFLLLCGETPFGGLDGESLVAVKQSILKANLRFVPSDVWESISQAAKDFVRCLLNPDPKKRPCAKEAQKLPWIQIWAKKDVKEGTKLNKKTVGALMAFKESSDMQKLLSEVLSFTLLPEQIVDLKKEFEKIDTEGVGEISLSAMKQILMENAEEGALGALSEQEVEDIFDAIRIRKTDPTIRWHEFLAAGLSQAKVDDRNLRLAFDRLDNERKGFITFDDIQDLLGSSTEYDALEKMWAHSLLECKAHLDKITFDDFKRLMKGQPKEKSGHSSQNMNLNYAFGTQKGFGPISTLSPPSNLRQGSTHLISVPEGKDPDPEAMALPEEQPSGAERNARYGKLRSRSFEQKGTVWDDGGGSLTDLDKPLTFIDKDATRALTFGSRADDFTEEFLKDATISPLVVNRALYRKHREMRLAVLEASKQFDKKRTERSDVHERGASLIMRRGAKPPTELEDKHQKAILKAAAQRSGRTKHARTKTVSDVSALIIKKPST